MANQDAIDAEITHLETQNVSFRNPPSWSPNKKTRLTWLTKGSTTMRLLSVKSNPFTRVLLKVSVN